MESRKLLSICTPTYNRSYILGNLYDSLCRQSSKDFEWIVIDDGSEDNTKNLVNDWRKKSEINISYYYQVNSGKNAAVNAAIDICETPWLMIVDSDDFLTNDAIEYINTIITEIACRNDVIGIVGPKGDKNGNDIYGNWPSEQYAPFYNLYEKYGFDGETVIIHRTDVVKYNKMPIIPGEKFMPENVWYRGLDNKGIYRYIERIIYCFEYKQDGLSQNALKSVINNPKGSMLSLKYEACSHRNLIQKAKYCAYYNAIGKIMHITVAEGDSLTIDSGVKLLGTFFAPYYYYKIIKGIKKYSETG